MPTETISRPTPGPWERDEVIEIIVGPNGEEVCAPVEGYDEDQWEADAPILAAAPDLLTVVRGFRRKLATYVSVYPGDKELRRLLTECDAVLAKVEGK